eukprot:scaffold8357_cov114-Isochrysis_galbana.AAC.2
MSPVELRGRAVVTVTTRGARSPDSSCRLLLTNGCTEALQHTGAPGGRWRAHGVWGGYRLQLGS